MLDWAQDEFLLFLLFFVPGFISIKVFDLLVPAERRNFQSTVSEAIGYSALNFAVLSPLIVVAAYGLGIFSTLWGQLAAVYVILLRAPVIWPLLFIRVIQPRFPRVFANPVPKPWDVVFRRGGESWIIVHLTDGRRIGARFARGRRHPRIQPRNSYI